MEKKEFIPAIIDIVTISSNEVITGISDGFNESLNENESGDMGGVN